MSNHIHVQVTQSNINYGERTRKIISPGKSKKKRTLTSPSLLAICRFRRCLINLSCYSNFIVSPKIIIAVQYY